MNKINFSSNQLKLIAIITMIIDHIAYYFSFILTDNTYLFFRIIGRISMPIFVFLIVQGYFHTKNLQRYIFRIFTLAAITQCMLYIVGYINYKFVPQYIINISNELNILFSLGLILIIIHLIELFFKNKNHITNILCILVVIITYLLIPIDYGFISPIMAICFYVLHKIKNDIIIYSVCLSTSIIFISLFVGNLFNYMILCIPFIILYNNKLGSKFKNSKFLGYVIFPIQHIILYLLGILAFYNINL